jgi:hypothetical protein
VAAMIYQALVDAKQVSAINSPYIVSAWERERWSQPAV